MTWNPLEINTANLTYACLGGFIVLFSMFSVLARERVYIGEVVFGTIFGIIIGPHCANLFDPRSWGNGSNETTNAVTLEVMRIVLAMGVFAVGVELPKAYLFQHWRSLTMMVVPVMAWGWLVGAGLLYALIPGLSFLSCLVINACLTPTDPILAAAIVSGKFAQKNVPGHLRRLLAAESAANDGLAYPFLFFSLYLTLEPTPGRAMGKFFGIACGYQVVLGSIIGAILGWTFQRLMRLSEKAGYIGTESYATQFISLALLSIGVTALLGSDDLLAAFAAGSAVSWDGKFNEKTEDAAVFANIIEVLLNCACFVYIGSWFRFADFHLSEINIVPWRLVVFVICLLLLRRFPPILLLYKWIPDVRNVREALFSGHFGPMGVGAVFISTLALTHLPQPHNPPQGQVELLAASIQPIVAFTVLCSIVVHGLSIPFFTLGKKVHTRTLSLSNTTFSRPSSITRGQPEWTTMVRRVVRKEDIVVSREGDKMPHDIETGSRHESVIQGEFTGGPKEDARIDQKIPDTNRVYQRSSPLPRMPLSRTGSGILAPSTEPTSSAAYHPREKKRVRVTDRFDSPSGSGSGSMTPATRAGTPAPAGVENLDSAIKSTQKSEEGLESEVQGRVKEGRSEPVQESSVPSTTNVTVIEEPVREPAVKFVTNETGKE